MEKFVVIRGSPIKNAREEPKNVWHGGDLQQRVEEFLNQHQGKTKQIIAGEGDFVYIHYED